MSQTSNTSKISANNFVENLYSVFNSLLKGVQVIDQNWKYRYVNDAVDHLNSIRFDNSLKLPVLILLDINLPKMNGHEVLALIKNTDDLKHIPVIMLTTSTSENDVLKSYQNHANCYVSKPVDIGYFMKTIASIENFWMYNVRLPNLQTR